MVQHRLPHRVILAVAASLVLVGTAAAARPATTRERAQLVAAVQAAQGDVGFKAVRVSTVDRTYALVEWGAKGNQHELFRLQSRRWVSVWRREFDRPADGACAYVPAKVVRDLLGVGCPPAKALHARRATAAEVAQMFASLKKSPLTPWWRDAKALKPVCVSRLNARWAAAQARFTGTAAVVWFRRKAAWRPVYETVVGRGTMPPHAVLLSLAACVGYSAADYGA